MTQTTEAATLPLEDQDVALTPKQAAAKASLKARTPGRVVCHAASVVACIALLVLPINGMSGRRVDLPTFLLVLLSVIASSLLIWRLHSLWLYLDQPERLARSHQRDPLRRIALLALWRDRTSNSFYGAATAMNLVIFGHVSDRFASLPPFLPLHYGANGDVDRLGTPSEVYIMPVIGLVVLIANLILGALLYRRERCAVYLLGGATVFVQLVLFVATSNVISRA